MPVEKLLCKKCGRERAEKEFFKMRDGSRCDLCKECLTLHIDNQDPQTFLWICEKFDIPFIRKKWVELCNKSYEKNPLNFGPMSVIGTYIRTMINMSQYKDFRYSDTDRLNFEDEKLQQEAEARKELLSNDAETIAYVTELEDKLARGEITEAEFRTLNPLLDTDRKPVIPDFIKPLEVNEDEILAQLSKDDRTYLGTKWGLTYKPSEWVRMEDMYNQYAQEYNLNTDRRETLIKMCKTSLKMDQCLDIGDINSLKTLSATWDQLRKSGKFTEAQKTASDSKVLNSIGELAALCEREGGIIPQFESPTEYPKDKVDITINDLKSYTYNLVANELGLGNLIESYIQKLEKAEEERDKEDIAGSFVTSAEDESKNYLTDQEVYEFNDFLEAEVQEDIDNLMRATGDVDGTR